LLLFYGSPDLFHISVTEESNPTKKAPILRIRQGQVITLDAYAASHRAIRELKSAGSMSRRVQIRSSKYLNNVVEQDHRRVKQRIGPMLGFKRFDTATITISGIELAEKIKKAQFKIGKLARRSGTAPTIWAAVLTS
jgi:transposase-like protein